MDKTITFPQISGVERIANDPVPSFSDDRRLEHVARQQQVIAKALVDLHKSTTELAKAMENLTAAFRTHQTTQSGR